LNGLTPATPLPPDKSIHFANATLDSSQNLFLFLEPRSPSERFLNWSPSKMTEVVSCKVLH